MALAQQINNFGSNHPGLNFIGGLAAGVALTAAATFGALTMQSQSNIEAVRPTQTSLSQEWSAPRVLVSNAGTVVRSPEIDVLSAARIGGGKTYDAARIQTQEQTLYTERVPVGLVATSLRTGPTLEQAAAMDEALFQGGGVFDNLVRASVRSGPTLEQAAAIDHALFEGVGLFEAAGSGALLSRGTPALTAEQAYGAEQAYRSANDIGTISSIVSTGSSTITPELRAGIEDQVSGHRGGGGLDDGRSSEEEAIAAERVLVR